MKDYFPSSVRFFRRSPMAKLQLGHTKKSKPSPRLVRISADDPPAPLELRPAPVRKERRGLASRDLFDSGAEA
jgi:hypothetical protein